MSNLLDKASIILTPTAYNNGEALCVKPSDGSGDFDFSRATEATRVNSQGLVETIGINLPRINYEGFSYDGSGNVVPDSGCGSWLWEPQSTNLITQSELFSDAYWSKTLMTATDNSTISPSGNVNASLIQEEIYTNSIPNIKNNSSITSLNGNNTLSFYVKNNSGRYLGVSFGSNAQRIITNFDFDTETFKTPIFNGTTTGSVSFDKLGDYYRILITANFPISINPQIFITPLATDTYPFYAFQNSDNRSFYLWGAQVEQQSYATSYIPTEGSTVTRNQDVCTNGGSLASINSTSGTLYAEIAVLSADNINRYLSLSNGTDDNSISFHFRNNANNQIRVILKSGNVNQFDSTYNPFGSTDFAKVAFKYKVNDFALWVNGIEIATDTSGITFPIDTLNRLSFDDGNGASKFFGKTKALAVWKEALSDQELAELTTI